MKSYLKYGVILGILTASLSTGISFALTDDTGVIDGLNKDTDAYTYLNTYHYHLWNPDNRDLYGSSDNQVVIHVAGYMNITDIFILGGDYATDKGIRVGDSAEDVIKAYGQVYGGSDYSMEGYANTGRVIRYDSHTWDYSGYIEYEYRDLRNSGISFIINKHTNKVALIRYQGNRHGGARGLGAAMHYNLLPKLK